jgi:hypothetical protein
MLAHTRGGAIIRKYTEAKGRAILENGNTVSPPEAGYVNGNDRIVPVVEVTVDNSTGADTTRTAVETVEADRVLRTVTIADTTAEAIAEREARRIAEVKETFDSTSQAAFVLLKISFLQENRIRTLEGKQPITAAQFRSWVDGQVN